MNIVFCLHGMAGLPVNQTAIAKEIKNKDPTAVVFHLNYTKSRSGHVLAAVEEAFCAIKERLSDIQHPITLIGHSKGALVALYLTLFKSELNVEKCCLIAPPLRSLHFINIPVFSKEIKDSFGAGSPLIQLLNQKLGEYLEIDNPLDPHERGGAIEIFKSVIGLFKILKIPTLFSLLSNFFLMLKNKNVYKKIFDNQRVRKIPKNDTSLKVNKTKFLLIGGKKDPIVPLDVSIPQNLRRLNHPLFSHYVFKGYHEHSHMLYSKKLIGYVRRFVCEAARV